jgi:hypothetical protein
VTSSDPPTFEQLVEVLESECVEPNPQFVILLKQLFAGGLESDYALSDLMARADEFFEELLIVFKPIREELAERTDGSHNWYYNALLDCIASASSPKVLSVLYNELRHPHSRARQVAIGRLQAKGKTDAEARKLLWNARKFQLDGEEETQAFRDAISKALKGLPDNI